MTDTITIIGTLATIQVASLGGFYLLMKAELRLVRSELDIIRRDLASGFERQELLLRLHEAEHHK